MKKSKLIACFAVLFIACGTSDDKKAEDTVAEETQPVVSYPYTATYSSDWKIGNPENARIVLDLYKAVEENRIDDFDKYLADSVTTIAYDETELKTRSKQEIIQKVKNFRNGFKTLDEEFLAFTSLHSNDKNEDWVLTWMTERVIRNDGSKDSTTYQETWRFKDGKIYYRGAFARYKPS